MRRIDRKKYLTDAEASRLLTLAHGFTDDAGKRDYVVLVTLLNSGLRIGELLRLRVRDVVRETVSDDDGTVTLHGLDVFDGKGGVSRRVYVNEELHETLCRWIREAGLGFSPDALLFAHEIKGETRGYTRRAFAYRLKRLLALAGLPSWYRLHSLRHTYAMRYLRATKSLVALREQLGHAGLATTQIYVSSTAREYERNLQAVRPMMATGRRGAKPDVQG